MHHYLAFFNVFDYNNNDSIIILKSLMYLNIIKQFYQHWLWNIARVDNLTKVYPPDLKNSRFSHSKLNPTLRQNRNMTFTFFIICIYQFQIIISFSNFKIVVLNFGRYRGNESKSNYHPTCYARCLGRTGTRHGTI